ncbi:MAG TPA: hypothetical protein VNH65_10575 [Candidatus Acidoferrum sp.]|nr:hypothetical protein [Candidatus Acidoferrum sp.]
MAIGGYTMTLKDEFLFFWVICLVVITFAVRHFLGGVVYLAEQAAAFSIVYLPSILHLLIGDMH